MQPAEILYVVICDAIVFGAGLFCWKAFRQRPVAPWPAGAELRILDGLFLAAAISFLLGGVVQIVDALEAPAGDRDWSRVILTTFAFASIPLGFGGLWYLRSAASPGVTKPTPSGAAAPEVTADRSRVS
jgi:hypothetical protein